MASPMLARMNVKRLIRLVQDRHAIWDIKHDDYNNKTLLKDIWEEIGRKMNCSGEVCKLKWRSLRDVFRRELKKYQTRLNNPKIRDKSLPRWFFFKELQFLTEHLTGLDNGTEYPEEYFKPDNTSEDYFESSYVKTEPDLLDDEISLEADDDVLLSLTNSDNTGVKFFTESSRKSDSFQITDTNLSDEIQSERTTKQGRNNSNSPIEHIQRKRIRLMEETVRDEDSDYHFLMSLLPFLRDIPQQRKMLVRTKIQNIFCEEIEAGNSSNV